MSDGRMLFLIDTSRDTLDRKAEQFPGLVGGQLLTPLTRYADAGAVYAIDNGCFGQFPEDSYRKLLNRQASSKDRCLFVTVPDIVGNARRTMEIWKRRHQFCSGWKMALVAQDGMEDLEIPWDELAAIFIGGTTRWKDSSAAYDIVKTAVILGKHSHVGRVNAIDRYRRFDDLGANTCDGSGIARFDHMLETLAANLERTPEEQMALPGVED